MRNTLLLFAALLVAPSAFAQANISDVVINEILLDPNGGPERRLGMDGDGTSDTDDEFIELYNTTGGAVDIIRLGYRDDDNDSSLSPLAHPAIGRNCTRHTKLG